MVTAMADSSNRTLVSRVYSTGSRNSRHSQKGMTGIGIALVLAMVGFFAVIGLKLFPVYMESFKVNSAMDSLKTESGMGSKSSGEIVKSLLRRLGVDDVESVTRDEISIEKSKTAIIVYVEYEVEKHLFGNISLLVIFDKVVEIPK